MTVQDVNFTNYAGWAGDCIAVNFGVPMGADWTNLTATHKDYVELVNKDENPNAEVQEGVLPFKDRSPFEKALAASTLIFMIVSIIGAVVLLFMAGMNAAADTQTLDAMIAEMGLDTSDIDAAYVIAQTAVLARATVMLVFALIIGAGGVIDGFIRGYINKPRRGFVKGLILSILAICTFQVVPGVLLLVAAIRAKKAK